MLIRFKESGWLVQEAAQHKLIPTDTETKMKAFFSPLNSQCSSDKAFDVENTPAVPLFLPSENQSMTHCELPTISSDDDRPDPRVFVEEGKTETDDPNTQQDTPTSAPELNELVVTPIPVVSIPKFPLAVISSVTCSNCHKLPATRTCMCADCLPSRDLCRHCSATLHTQASQSDQNGSKIEQSKKQAPKQSKRTSGMDDTRAVSIDPCQDSTVSEVVRAEDLRQRGPSIVCGRWTDHGMTMHEMESEDARTPKYVMSSQGQKSSSSRFSTQSAASRLTDGTQNYADRLEFQKMAAEQLRQQAELNECTFQPNIGHPKKEGRRHVPPKDEKWGRRQSK
ncbi:hypothetical protein BLNAU_23294 [Blattamonas nauphoetae]|uniref:Uncharacterized protein n=1 Tax=Blattamonas nauphoetae TaxID=2049346 RepID=A0ABQ9WQN2_9EUKA|nr:hypothetical protein BLNAU_23294 [Blattamonas nauphoetae]